MGSDFDWGVGGEFPPVRSSAAFAPPYIVVHGSTGSCLLTGPAKFWSWSWAPDLPVGQTRDENQGGNLLPRTCWPELSAAFAAWALHGERGAGSG